MTQRKKELSEMTTPKSDTATIEARRHRLLELLSEGRTEAQAAEILRKEGYPASVPTVWRDVRKLSINWRDLNQMEFEEFRGRQFEELQDLKIALTDLQIKPE